MRFPYGCICRKNFFDKTETTDTTYTTIWKPGLMIYMQITLCERNIVDIVVWFICGAKFEIDAH